MAADACPSRSIPVEGERIHTDFLFRLLPGFKELQERQGVSEAKPYHGDGHYG